MLTSDEIVKKSHERRDQRRKPGKPPVELPTPKIEIVTESSEINKRAIIVMVNLRKSMKKMRKLFQMMIQNEL
jgi:hypothetical protein